MEEDIEPIPIIDNLTFEILKPKKEGRNNALNIFKKNFMDQQSSAASQEKEFPIIESYCMMLERDKEKDINNKERNKYETTNFSNSNTNINNLASGNESKLEAKQVEDLKDCVNKILNEF